LAQLAKLVFQIAYQIAMARLLVPEQFGIVAMASPIFAFAVLIGDLGLSQAAIQRESVTEAQLSILFWANLAVTAVLVVVLIACSSLIADFYREPMVAPVLSVMAAALVIGALGSQHLVLLNRKLRFATLATIDLASFFAGASLAVEAASLGFGLWSLIVQQVVSTTVMTVALWTTVRWRPARPRRFSDGSGLLRFGADVTAANVAGFFARNVDNVLIGRIWGDAPLGLYDRAYKLLLLPLNQLVGPMSKIAVPLLSRVMGDDSAYRRAYFLMLELIIILTFPGALFALITREQLILVLLGAQWAAVAPIFGVLAIGALFAPIGGSMTWLLISQGRTRELRNYSVVSSVGFVLGIVGGLPWGPLGVATGYVAFGLIQGPLMWDFVTRTGPADRSSFWSALVPYVLGCLPVAGVILLLQHTLPDGWVSLMLIFLASYVMFFLVLLAQKATRKNLLLLLKHFFELTEDRVIF
jgi:PST family polysaccharide transporter